MLNTLDKIKDQVPTFWVQMGMRGSWGTSTRDDYSSLEQASALSVGSGWIAYQGLWPVGLPTRWYIIFKPGALFRLSPFKSPWPLQLCGMGWDRVSGVREGGRERKSYRIMFMEMFYPLEGLKENEANSWPEGQKGTGHWAKPVEGTINLIGSSHTSTLV